MPSRRLLIPALVAVLLVPAIAQALAPAETAQVDTLVGEALSDTGVPSASVAIVRGGRIVFAKAYGKQSERTRATDPRAPYQIASISKQFTAAAILPLEDGGKLSLDDTVAKYIPGVTGGERITIRQLLGHTSGLRDYWPQDYSFGAMAIPTTPQGIVEIPAATGWLYAAGELAMSAEDLARWDVARLDRTLLPADDWAAQETPVRLADGTNTDYGLGVFANTRDVRRFVEHGGEAVGFLSENIVYPDDRAAIVVLVNAWFGDAHNRIADGIAKAVLPPAASDDDAAAPTKAHTVFDALRGGTLDRGKLTDDADFYFTATAIADYRASLGTLGEPTAFVRTGRTRQRGGFVDRATFASRTGTISTYAESGGTHRYEQFLATPAQ